MSSSWPLMAGINIPEVRHFIYKFRSIAQFAAPVLDIPYKEVGGRANPNPNPNPNAELTTSQEFRRLFSTYSRIHARLHNHTRPLKLLYWVGDTENWMGWVRTQNFIIQFNQNSLFDT